jgi:uncharacterized lipoprotein YmbA
VKVIASRSKRAGLRIVAAATLLVLSACASSPPSRFYTLAPDTDTPSGSRLAGRGETIDLSSVNVPAQVARSQLVVRMGGTQVKVLEEQRWASPLADEIRTALSAMLVRRLSGVETRDVRGANDASAYRVVFDVQRFESWPGSYVLIDAVWGVRPANGGQTLTCRSTVEEPVAQGYDALIEGHRRALEVIAEQLATSIRSMRSHALSACAP